MRTGFYNPRGGFASGYNSNGGWWYSANGPTGNGQMMITIPSEIYSIGYNPRGYGFAIRCTIRVE